MAEYARIENDAILERREIEIIPPHKAYLWRPVVYEGSGNLSDIVIEANQVRVVRSEPPPAPITADTVRAEAQRRIIALTGTQDIIGCLTKQHNAQMRATELTLVLAAGGEWTTEQAAEAAALQAMADKIKAIRAASNAMEGSPPADYADDSRWPELPSQ